MNLEFFMPSRSASRFIMPANASSDPAIRSASAMQASLPDCTIMPRISSSTVTGFFGSMNMREPGARQAFSEALTCSSSVSFFSLSAANTRYAVISLVSDAGSKRSSGFSAARIWPLETSATTQARPTTCGGCGACARASNGTTSSATASRTGRKRRSIGVPRAKGPRL